MLDPWFFWLESTAFSVWIREEPGLYAFPGILAVHTVGLVLIAGLNVALDLRLLGAAPQIPLATFDRYRPIMTLGLWLNVLSGIALLIGYPTKALTNPVFYLKLTFIAAALVILGHVRRHLGSPAASSGSLRVPAALSLVCWAGAIVAGRLLAYTYSRLTTIDTFSS
jgi:hypothetical protein